MSFGASASTQIPLHTASILQIAGLPVLGFHVSALFNLVSFPWLSEELYELYFSVTNVIFCIAVFKNYIYFMYFLP